MTHEQYGLAAYLCSHAHGRRSVADLNNWIMPAIQMRQIMFAFDRAGAPLAYWTWAYLAHDAEARLIADPNGRLHESEWNEAERLWVMEFVAPFGYVADIICYLRQWAWTSLGHERFRFRRGAGHRSAIWTGISPEGYSRVLAEGSVRFHLSPAHFDISHRHWLARPDRPGTAF